MADGAAVAALDPNAPPQANVRKLNGQPAPMLTPQDLARQEAAIIEERQKAEKAATQEHEATRGRLEGEYRDLSAREDATQRPPPFKPPPEPIEEHTSPERAWGSSAMVLAMLASAFTRTPMLTAINAAAEAIKGFHQGDQERFDRQFKTWQIANQNARDAWQYQQQVYQDIMARYEREKGDNLRQQVEADRVFSTEMTAAANQFKDERMLIATEQAGMLGAQRNVEQADRILFQFDKATMQTEQAIRLDQAMKEWMNSFKAQNGRLPTNEEQIVQYGKLMRESKGGGGLTEAQASAISSKARDKLSGTPESPGAKWNASRDNLAKLEAAIRDGDGRGVIQQSTIIDSYVQQQNNNRAVRQFLIHMFQSDAPLSAQAEILKNKILGQGGAITPEMAQELRELAHAYDVDLTQRYADAITAAQFHVHHTPGIDPSSVVPNDWIAPKTNVDGQPWPTPSPQHIAKLKQHAEDMQAWIDFDTVFGQGAAARALGSDPQ